MASTEERSATPYLHRVTLRAEQELRLFVPSLQDVEVTLEPEPRAGAEIFGAHLKPGVPYQLADGKSYGIFSWEGGTIRIRATSASFLQHLYVADSTPMPYYMELAILLNDARRAAAEEWAACASSPDTDAAMRNSSSPRVLVVGRKHSGKNALFQILLNIAALSGWCPIAIDMDVADPVIGCPGHITARCWETPLAVDEHAGGYLHAPLLSYPVGTMDPANSFARVDKVADLLTLALKRRSILMNQDVQEQASGFIINGFSGATDAMIRKLVHVLDLTHVILIEDEYNHAHLQTYYRKVGQGKALKTPKGGRISVELMPASNGIHRMSSDQVIRRGLHYYLYGGGKAMVLPVAHVFSHEEIEVYSFESYPSQGEGLSDKRDLESNQQLYPLYAIDHRLEHRIVTIVDALGVSEIPNATALCYGYVRKVEVDRIEVLIPSFEPIPKPSQLRSAGHLFHSKVEHKIFMVACSYQVYDVEQE